MSRVLTGLTAAALAVSAMSAAQAADYGVYDPSFKPAYPADWAQESPLGFEAGLRYWYSMGSQNFALNGSDYIGNDTSHIVEGHLRIDDYSTDTFLRANSGYAVSVVNSVNLPSGPDTYEGGRIAYATADFGYTPVSTGGLKLGGFVGYQYLNDSPHMGRENYYIPSTISWTPGSPDYTIGGASKPNSLDVHALRLGVTGKAELGNSIDISGDFAVIPYAWAGGVLGAHSVGLGTPPGGTLYPTSPVSVDGHLYGAAAEIMVGFRPTENLTLRIGARGYYLTGPVNSKYSTAFVTDPQDLDADLDFETGPTVANQNWIGTFSNFEMFRWGPMIELTASF